MILAIALNPALDVTYEMRDAVRWGSTNRVGTVLSRAGGKALNVASVLRQLGRETIVVAPCGGVAGASLVRDATVRHLDLRVVPIAGDTRSTIAVREPDSRTVTMLTEPGPRISEAEWAATLSVVHSIADEQSVEAVVMSGSLPPGAPDDAYAVLVRFFAARGATTYLDCDGRGFAEGLEAGPSVVKPNRDELEALGASTGSDDATAVSSGRDDADERAIRALAAAASQLVGPEAVVASDGARGLVAVTSHGRWVARPPAITDGNPTGAGDACVAGLVATGLERRSWPDRLRFAAALGAAAVGCRLAGDIGDRHTVESILTDTFVSDV